MVVFSRIGSALFIASLFLAFNAFAETESKFFCAGFHGTLGVDQGFERARRFEVELNKKRDQAREEGFTLHGNLTLSSGPEFGSPTACFTAYREKSQTPETESK